MCLHFYKREQHWKALYEAMCRSGSQQSGTMPADSFPQGNLSSNTFLSTAAKSLSTRSRAKPPQVHQPVLMKLVEKKDEEREEQKVRLDSVTQVAALSGTRSNKNKKTMKQTLLPEGQSPLAPRFVSESGVISCLISHRTKCIPHGTSRSGTESLERSVAGAVLDGGPASQIKYGGKGWTPVPPSPVSISHFTRLQTSARGKRRKRHLPANAKMPEVMARRNGSSAQGLSGAQSASGPPQVSKFAVHDANRGAGMYVGGRCLNS